MWDAPINFNPLGLGSHPPPRHLPSPCRQLARKAGELSRNPPRQANNFLLVEFPEPAHPGVSHASLPARHSVRKYSCRGMGTTGFWGLSRFASVSSRQNGSVSWLRISPHGKRGTEDPCVPSQPAAMHGSPCCLGIPPGNTAYAQENHPPTL